MLLWDFHVFICKGVVPPLRRICLAPSESDNAMTKGLLFIHTIKPFKQWRSWEMRQGQSDAAAPGGKLIF